jgi:hypothetical protein
MKWFHKKQPPRYEFVDRVSGAYSFKILHLVNSLQKGIEYREEGFHTKEQALRAAEDILQGMYSRGIRYYNKYLPPHRIQSSEIFIYCDGKKVPCDHP